MRHPQADLIKEWVEDTSRVVQCRVNEADQWEDCGPLPYWHPDFEYRFKPEPKPDVVRYTEAHQHGWRIPDGTENLKLTFDGETGKLKSAEVIE